MRDLVLIAHDLRSTHNIGSLLRTADGLGVTKIYLTGYTPYPAQANDTRLPHLAKKIDEQITKTALGAEKLVAWQHTEDVLPVLAELRHEGYSIVGLEQGPTSIDLPAFKAPAKVAVLLGREVEGIQQSLLDQCDVVVEIPMFGNKESFNVVQAAAMMLYHCRFIA